jgi:adenylosuccinate lyase
MSSKYIHKGLTSNDVKDTAMGVMMKQSAEILLKLKKKNFMKSCVNKLKIQKYHVRGPYPWHSC